MTNFIDVSELAGDEVSAEQVERLCHRYYWAGRHCHGLDVLEAACGSGAGLGYLAGIANSVGAGDLSEEILGRVRAHYGDRIPLRQFDAQDMPFDGGALDVVILFEALYFIPSPERFVAECRRVLRPGGKVLIATANKDLYDFNPAPYSTRYHSPRELSELFHPHGFSVECWGFLNTTEVSLRQRILRPVKKLAISLNLMPRTMAGKKLLKRLVFGEMLRMPAEIDKDLQSYIVPTPIPIDKPDRMHKVIYCAATLF